MKLIYTPEDGDREVYDFIPAKLLSPEAEAIEDVGGNAWDTFEEFGQKFMRGSVRARRAALWVMKRRVDPKFRFDQCVFKISEIDVDFSTDELTRVRGALEQMEGGDLPEADRTAALQQIDEALRDRDFEGGSVPNLSEPLPNSDDESTNSDGPESLPGL